MVTDAQVRLLRKLMEKKLKTIASAAAAAGMSERSAHKWKAGSLPSETKGGRTWRTREDPFASVWETTIEPMLKADTQGVLESKTMLAELRAKKGDAYGPPLLRTLQRRVQEWRALHGPGKEVMFEQVHPPGREAAFDFTDMTEIGITIAGVLFEHLIFQLVLSFSKWRWIGLAFSETFEAMLRGLQDALWELGGAPAVWRSDNLSAATHQLPGGGRELNRRYRDVLEHSGASSSRIEPGESHQNGTAEKGHDVLKSAVRQALVLRGSRDFVDVGAYEKFLQKIRATLLESHKPERLVEELAALRPLPSSRVPSYTSYEATVRTWSTIHFGRRTYSVPSRLIGQLVQVRLHPDVVEVWYRDKLTETMPRLRGAGAHRIDYRHVIWSLVRKPGAFARYRYREELFPSLVFRRAYDALVGARLERADVEYVRVLHLAASTMQSDVEAALEGMLERGERPDFLAVKALVKPEKTTIPILHIPAPDPAMYDRLLRGGEA